MSLSLKFSSTIDSRFLKVVASDEVTFYQISTVNLVQLGIVAGTVDVTGPVPQDFHSDEYYFKGRLSLPNASPCDVFVKILLGDDEKFYSELLQSYIQEAKFYRDHLCGNKSLYGKAVPKLYGLYETKVFWKTYNTHIDCACSGLSDFGLQAANILIEMHSSGIIHNSVDLDRSIAYLDDKPFFIDFSQARDHVCPDKGFEFSGFYDLDVDNLSCGELQYFFRRMRNRVAPPFFHWYGYDIRYKRVKSLDEIFQQERRTFASEVPVEEQWEHAVEVWTFLCANWSSYHTGKAPEVGDTSYEAYRARCDSEIIYYDDDDDY
ncbi:hypothetical protein C0993_006882 [Termitomyces sp. T159_Od127]|nr:hypothetical protein C0993_006882 [Termitomyces sp. T159_Od127]